MEDNLGWSWHWVTETITLILMQILLLLFFCHLTWAFGFKEVMIIPKKKKKVRMDIRWFFLSLHMHLMWVSSGHCSLRFKVGQVISNPLCFPSSHPLLLVRNPDPCLKPLGCSWCVQGVSCESSQGSLVSCCRLLLRAAASVPTVCVCLCWMSPHPQGTDPAPHLYPIPHGEPLCPSANTCPCPPRCH